MICYNFFMNIPDSYHVAELVIKKSRFIGEVFVLDFPDPKSIQKTARDFLKRQKEKYFDATHVVHGFIAGDSGSYMGCSDDGEPSGTAGKPVLDILKGSGYTNIFLTVTRYFGGVLLGTGGLVKAYGDTAKAVLSAVKPVPLIRWAEYSLSCPYCFYEGIKKILTENGAVIKNEEFSQDITMEYRIPFTVGASAAGLIKDFSGGKVVPVLKN